MFSARFYLDPCELLFVKHGLAGFQHRVYGIASKIFARHFAAASGIYRRALPREYWRSLRWAACTHRTASKD
jgi:hypothetical protein